LNTEISLLVPEMEPMKTGATIRFRVDERKGCKFRFSDSKAFALSDLSRHKKRDAITPNTGGADGRRNSPVYLRSVGSKLFLFDDLLIGRL
jgi:hypothetical protein